MEDLEDNLPTIGKRYYLSHSEYYYTDKAKKNILEYAPSFDISYLNEQKKLTQLVCASNLENARKAVTNQLEESGQYRVTRCRIDYLVIGD
jgi:hypothetical protein